MSRLCKSKERKSTWSLNVLYWIDELLDKQKDNQQNEL